MIQGIVKTIITTAFFVLALCGSNPAQSKPPSAAGKIPFDAGETLNYEGKLSRIISGITVADLTFSVENASGDGQFLIRADARSKGTLLSLFRFSFSQALTSTVARDEFKTIKTVKHDVQKDRVRDSEALFDYHEKRVTFIETDPKEPMKPPRKIASGIDDSTHDLVTGIYALRLLPLAVGKSFELTVSDSGLVYEIPVKVTARELQKTIFGKVWCFRVEPDVFGPGRMIESNGKMVLWITDDARRIPVRSMLNTWVGKIDIRLKSASNRK